MASIKQNIRGLRKEDITDDLLQKVANGNNMQLLEWTSFPIQTGLGIHSDVAGVGDNKGRLTGFYGYELTCVNNNGEKCNLDVALKSKLLDKESIQGFATLAGKNYEKLQKLVEEYEGKAAPFDNCHIRCGVTPSLSLLKHMHTYREYIAQHCHLSFSTYSELIVSLNHVITCL